MGAPSKTTTPKTPRPKQQKPRPDYGGRTEEELVAAVKEVCETLCRRHAFAWFTEEDISQEVWRISLEILARPGKYDQSRPLPNFLYRHAFRQLLNLRRKFLFRNEPPCPECHAGLPCEEAVEEKCRRYSEWLRCNMTKAHLACPTDIGDAPEEKQSAPSTAENDSYEAELLARIDAFLPASMRSDYLRVRDGAALPPARRKAVEDCVREILRGVVDC